MYKCLVDYSKSKIRNWPELFDSIFGFHLISDLNNGKQIKHLRTVHLRRRQIFTIFDPSAFQQIAYEGDF